MECKIPNGIDMTQQASWCPGCGHGIIVRLLAEAAEALGIEDNAHGSILSAEGAADTAPSGPQASAPASGPAPKHSAQSCLA